MPRFFVEPAAIAGDTVQIVGEDCRHIGLSLRMAVGDEIFVCDGGGTECLCRLTAIRPDAVTGEILSRRAGRGELPCRVTLYQGNPKGDKLDLIVQKATELGACAIIPFESSRCVVRVRAERSEKQTARLTRIAREAACQCGRSVLPRVGSCLSYAAALADAKRTQDAVLFCYEDAVTEALSLRTALSALPQGIRSLGIFVGSEGGFSPEEAAAAIEQGMTPVTFGARILRCETAAIYALSAVAIQFE